MDQRSGIIIFYEHYLFLKYLLRELLIFNLNKICCNQNLHFLLELKFIQYFTTVYIYICKFWSAVNTMIILLQISVLSLQCFDFCLTQIIFFLFKKEQMKSAFWRKS